VFIFDEVLVLLKSLFWGVVQLFSAPFVPLNQFSKKYDAETTYNQHTHVNTVKGRYQEGERMKMRE